MHSSPLFIWRLIGHLGGEVVWIRIRRGQISGITTLPFELDLTFVEDGSSTLIIIIVPMGVHLRI